MVSVNKKGHILNFLGLFIAKIDYRLDIFSFYHLDMESKYLIFFKIFIFNIILPNTRKNIILEIQELNENSVNSTKKVLSSVFKIILGQKFRSGS